jgi:hypothetical protein
MTGSLSASSGQLDCLPCVFRPNSSVDDVSAGVPCSLPFRSVLVGLVDEPVDSLPRGADYNAHAAVSQDQGNVPAVYLPIPMKPPLCSEMIAPSFLVGSAGSNCCQFVQVRCQSFRGRFRRKLSPLSSMRWALWTSRSWVASA